MKKTGGKKSRDRVPLKIAKTKIIPNIIDYEALRLTVFFV
jgi:hypothetical protein